MRIYALSTRLQIRPSPYITPPARVITLRDDRLSTVVTSTCFALLTYIVSVHASAALYSVNAWDIMLMTPRLVQRTTRLLHLLTVGQHIQYSILLLGASVRTSTSYCQVQCHSDQK